MGQFIRRKTAAFTLIELMIVVMIIGVLAAVAIPAFSRYVTRSRTPEQAQDLNKLWVGSVTYYQVDHADSNNGLLPRQFPTPLNPGAGDGVEGHDFAVPFANCGCFSSRKCPGMGPLDLADPTLKAVNYAQPDPHSFRVQYLGSGTGTASQFTAKAIGDLDCDTTLSQYYRVGGIDSANNDVTGQNLPIAINDGE